MALLESLILVAHVMIAIAVCGFVLLQHGKGADMGAAFGSGSSGSLFGASGSANFLSRSTSILATLFFATSLGLTWLGSTAGTASRSVVEKGVMQSLPVQKTSDVPPVPAGGTAGGAADAGKAVPATGTPAPAAPSGSKSSEVPK